jgi:hypothetical protein
VLYPTDAAMGLRAALSAAAAAEGAEAMRCEVEALPAADGTDNTENHQDSGALVLSVQLSMLSATNAASARRATEALATVAAAALRRTLPGTTDGSSLQLTVRMVSAEPPQAARSLSRRMALPVAALQVSFPSTPTRSPNGPYIDLSLWSMPRTAAAAAGLLPALVGVNIIPVAAKLHSMCSRRLHADVSHSPS